MRSFFNMSAIAGVGVIVIEMILRRMESDDNCHFS